LAIPFFKTTRLTSFWRAYSKCTDKAAEDSELAGAWISYDSPNKAKAIIICKSCPVRDMCLSDAVQDKAAEGIRGGFYFHRGKVIASDAEKIKAAFGLVAERKYKQKGRPKMLVPVDQNQAS
jgi:hypothetical protein